MTTPTPDREALEYVSPIAPISQGGPPIFVPGDILLVIEKTGVMDCLFRVAHRDGREGMWAASCFGEPVVIPALARSSGGGAWPPAGTEIMLPDGVSTYRSGSALPPPAPCPEGPREGGTVYASDGQPREPITDPLKAALGFGYPAPSGVGEREQRLERCLGFFASVIKSGEPWTETCQREYDDARARERDAA